MDPRKRDFPLVFLDQMREPLREAVSLRSYSSFGIGGKADYFFQATSLPKLKSAFRLARHHSIPCYIIGAGYNLLFDDDGFRGLIIKNKAKGIKFRLKEEEIEIFSGTTLRALVQFSIDEGLEGLEFLAGIPGTVGGAVFGNAGAFGESVGDFLKEAVLLDEKGEEVKVTSDYFKFRYRHSFLREKHDILLKVSFGLKKGDKQRIIKRIEENLEKRREKHPPQETACAGSYFKNPVLPDGKRIPAGYLLEQVGAKEIRIGDAAIFPGHSNFIINLNKASAREVLRLAQELKEKVKEKFGIELEEEVIFLPAGAPVA